MFDRVSKLAQCEFEKEIGRLTNANEKKHLILMEENEKLQVFEQFFKIINLKLQFLIG